MYKYLASNLDVLRSHKFCMPKVREAELRCSRTPFKEALCNLKRSNTLCQPIPNLNALKGFLFNHSTFSAPLIHCQHLVCVRRRMTTGSFGCLDARQSCLHSHAGLISVEKGKTAFKLIHVFKISLKIYQNLSKRML